MKYLYSFPAPVFWHSKISYLKEKIEIWKNLIIDRIA